MTKNEWDQLQPGQIIKAKNDSDVPYKIELVVRDHWERWIGHGLNTNNKPVNTVLLTGSHMGWEMVSG